MLKERLMMKSSKNVAAAVAAAVLVAGLCGCEKGPLEKAGKQIDNAFEKAGDKIEDATRKR
jgi:predicted small lipoprotein YifL